MFNEVHSIHGHTLLLITKPSLQATALLQHLKQSLAITGKLHNIQRSLDDISSGSIILLDMMEADKKLIHYWQDTLSRKNNNIKILLLNTPEDYPYRDIENWPHINGVFYAMEDQERVVNGLQGVLRGECYFTQKLASYLITHSGNYRYNSTESALLTHREKEILNKCQRQDYWPFFAIFNVRYWSLMLSAFRHFIITDWRGVFCQHSRFAFFL